VEKLAAQTLDKLGSDRTDVLMLKVTIDRITNETEKDGSNLRKTCCKPQSRSRVGKV
jgi:hypothetical protein